MPHDQLPDSLMSFNEINREIVNKDIPAQQVSVDKIFSLGIEQVMEFYSNTNGAWDKSENKSLTGLIRQCSGFTFYQPLSATKRQSAVLKFCAMLTLGKSQLP